VADVILTINAGSSSIKFAFYEIAGTGELRPGMHGQLEGMGTKPHLIAEEGGGEIIIDRDAIGLAGDGANSLVALLHRELAQHRLIAVGHRVAHGGPFFTAPTLVTGRAIAEMQKLIPLAPLHQPFNIGPMKAISQEFPDVPQVACFDTSFHHGHSEVVDHFAIPRQLHEEGVRRYGFHGLSYEFIARSLRAYSPRLADGRVVVAHLGSGASMCAIRSGKSVDCTMSFTALGGLPMATRSGDLDPGVVLYLLREKGLDPTGVERLLDNQSGLAGLSGFASDMRTLEASADPRATFAIDHFVYRICYSLAGLASTLGGLDGVIFTAGIGEHSRRVRGEVLRRCDWLGITLDDERNALGGPRITTDASTVSAWVIPTDENLMIGRHTYDVVTNPSA
jgi:acetate kinase